MNASSFTYQIRVKGHLSGTLSEWLAPLQIVNEPSGEATLTGSLRDQAELYGVLLKLYNLNFTLIAVQRITGGDCHDHEQGNERDKPTAPKPARAQ